MKYFVYAVIGVVSAAVIAGFFIVGSPGRERARRFDDQRVQDLQYLQSSLINYWIGKAKLPENLTLLNDDISGVKVPQDPETGANYQYQILAADDFKLCANFDLTGPGESGVTAVRPIYQAGYSGPGNWQHGAGLVCFERKIDKEIYKPIKPR